MYIPRNISETFLTFVLLPQEKIWKIELIFMFSEFQKKEILNIFFFLCRCETGQDMI